MLSIGLFLLWQSVESCCSIAVVTRTAEGAPVAGAIVRIESGAIRHEVPTDDKGHARQVLRTPGRYTITVTANQFEAVTRQTEVGRDQNVELEIVLTQRRRDEVTVTAEPDRGEPASTVARDQIRSLPERVADVRNALPLIPGVVRTPEGKLNIASAPEHQSTFLLNSVDVTDPATGSFGITVPVDVIERLNVYKSPFLAEYGQFSAAVVAVSTRRGGDKWHYELNDPTPEFRIRSGHIVGVRGFTPRFAATGPLIRGKLFFAGGTAFALRKRPVYPLPFPFNEERSQSLNTYLQFDYIRSPAHLITLALHGAPQKANFVGLSFLTPQPAAASWKAHEYRAAVTDRFDRNGTVFESIVSVAETRGITGAQGEETMVLLPSTTEGNYFFRQDRVAQRLNLVENVTLAPLTGRGQHSVRLGALFAQTRLHGHATGRDVIAGTELLPIFGGRPYRLSDTEVGIFAQDGWEPAAGLRLDMGVRADWQRLPGGLRVAPRTGIAWMPFESTRTVFRGGVGLFYDRVPPLIYAFPYYPSRNSQPNVLAPGTFMPRALTASVEIDQPVGRHLVLHAGQRHTRATHQLIVYGSTIAANGTTRSRQTEVTARFRFYEEQDWAISYVHTHARGNLEPFTRLVGDFPAPVIRPPIYGPMPDIIPHRFLTWGVFPVRYGLRIAPMVEWRNGFPYSSLDIRQQYAGIPNSLYLPAFFSFDWRVSKDIAVRGHKVRFAFSMFNATDHANYDAIRLSVADPQFGEALGRRNRRFRLDFDWLF